MKENKTANPKPETRNSEPHPPIAWTIAGSDSSGGAGIQADLKTFQALGVHGCSVLTAVTAQNSRGVQSVEGLSDEIVSAQMDSLGADLPPSAIKLGMLAGHHTLQSVMAGLDRLSAPVVCDPVLASSGGVPLLEPQTIPLLKSRLFPRVHLLTPNIPEAEILLGRKIQHAHDMEAAATDLLQLGPRAILLKGGHLPGEYAQDFWTNGREQAWLTLPRLHTENDHGTGCVLSSAIAACRARGYPELDSIVVAKAFVQQGLRAAVQLGQGRGSLALGGWPSDPQDLPWITRSAEEALDPPLFPDCGLALFGLYPIVDRADWLKKLLPLGISTVQLRIKDLDGPALEKEIEEAVACARSFNARLFINDQWKLAIRCRAYGVHLGQDDLASADLNALSEAGLRLGISTHSYSEVARAWACRPSYIALGTLFNSPSKEMDYAPLGLEEFRHMARLIPVPVVAIGGITLERALEVLEAGAEGLAVISDIVKARNLADRVHTWQEFLHPFSL